MLTDTQRSKLKAALSSHVKHARNPAELRARQKLQRKLLNETLTPDQAMLLVLDLMTDVDHTKIKKERSK